MGLEGNLDSIANVVGPNGNIARVVGPNGVIWERAAPVQLFSGNISYTPASNVTVVSSSPPSYTNLLAGASIMYTATLRADNRYIFSGGQTQITVTDTVNVPAAGGNINVDLTNNTVSRIRVSGTITYLLADNVVESGPSTYSNQLQGATFTFNLILDAVEGYQFSNGSIRLTLNNLSFTVPDAGGNVNVDRRTDTVTLIPETFEFEDIESQLTVSIDRDTGDVEFTESFTTTFLDDEGETIDATVALASGQLASYAVLTPGADSEMRTISLVVTMDEIPVGFLNAGQRNFRVSGSVTRTQQSPVPVPQATTGDWNVAGGLIDITVGTSMAFNITTNGQWAVTGGSNTITATTAGTADANGTVTITVAQGSIIGRGVDFTLTAREGSALTGNTVLTVTAN